jgi:hypothetical protein
MEAADQAIAEVIILLLRYEVCLESDLVWAVNKTSKNKKKCGKLISFFELNCNMKKGS